MQTEFWIKRDNIRETQFVEADTPTLEANQVLLKIEHFAFTANNISYAHSGEALGYWKFFPTGVDGWGKLPVWGYADVVESKHEAIHVNDRFYGFYPLASYVVLQPDKVSAGGFVDGIAHRQALPAVYNRYARSSKSADDHLNSLLRPMFITSFLLDDFLADNDFFGADQIIASSASSKTAYAMAQLLHAQKADRRPYDLIGLTSAKNMDFVQSLGIYDHVIDYADMATLDSSVKTVYVDFASNGALRKSIHEHFADQLRYDAIVGGTHWDQLGTAKGLQGAKPEFFFAPTYIQKRLGDWGREGYQEKTDTAWANFIESARAWVDVSVGHGKDAVSSQYQSMLDGQSDPRAGTILSL